MKDTLENLGYVVVGLLAGFMLRGIYEQERQRIALERRKVTTAVAAVRG